jgi:phosphoglycolate phosphatase-like HAD superfamily hydrolase
MPLDLARIQAICFDVDGTLSDTDDQFVRRLVRVLHPLQRILPGIDIHRLARKVVMFTEGPGNLAYSLADNLGLDSVIVRLGDHLYDLGIGATSQPFQLVNGVPEMLNSLRKYYPLSIISARGQKSTSRFLAQFDLASLFKVVVTGQTCRHTKPYADPIEWAASRMGVTASACLMVGDTVVDILCGKKAGAQTVGVLCGFGDQKELEKAGADYILDNPTELIDLLVR